MYNIITQHQDQIVKLIRQYDVNYLALFGSHARGQSKTGSDIDLLVDYNKPIGLFKFVNLQKQLSDILGLPVDLVSRRGVSKYLKPYIQDDLQVVYEEN